MHTSALKAIADLEDTYWWFVGKNRIITSLIDQYAPPSPRSLDVGCGPGGMLQVLSDRGEAVGVDVSDDALAYCHERGLEAIKGALPHDLPFDPASFDLIIASEVIEHVQDDAASAEALVSLLRPGGVLIATVPALQWMWTRHDELNHHFRRYTTARFAGLFDGRGVQTLVLSYYNTTMFPLMVASRLAGKVRSMVSPPPDEIEIKPLPCPINDTMTHLFAMEGKAITRTGLPIGGSVIACFRKPPVS